MALICPSCQTENVDGTQFCQGCGSSLAGVRPAQPTQPTQPTQPEETGYDPSSAPPPQPGDPRSTGYDPSPQEPGQQSTGYDPSPQPVPGAPGGGEAPSTGYQPQGGYGGQESQWTGYDPAGSGDGQQAPYGGRQPQQPQWTGYDPTQTQPQQGQYPPPQQGQYPPPQQGQWTGYDPTQTQQGTGTYAPPQQGQYGPQQGRWPGYESGQGGQQPPGGYSSPYYQPRTSPQVSRTSPGVVVGMAAAIVGILVVIVIVIVLVARSVHGGNVTPTTHPSVAPSPKPTAGGGGGGQTVSVGSVSIQVLSGFQLSDKDDTSVELEADDGAVLVASGQTNSPITLDQLFQSAEADLQKKYPDVSTCVDDQELTVAGKQGHVRGYKYTEQGDGGNSVVACHVYWYSVGAGGKTVYEWQQVSADSDFDEFEAKAQKERATIKWKI